MLILLLSITYALSYVSKAHDQILNNNEVFYNVILIVETYHSSLSKPLTNLHRMVIFLLSHVNDESLIFYQNKEDESTEVALARSQLTLFEVT